VCSPTSAILRNVETRFYQRNLISKFHHALNVVFFFWVVPHRLNFACQIFGTLRVLHLHRRC
jgi:hypothetical protein